MLTHTSTHEEIRAFYDNNPTTSLEDVCIATKLTPEEVFFILCCED